MAIARVEPNCDLWFFTGRTSEKVRDIQNDQQVLIIFQDEHGRFLSLAGSAKLVADQNKIHEFWDDGFERWFPKGVNDPSLMLIFVRAESAEYWQESIKGIKHIFETAKAFASGGTPHLEQEEHAKVALK
jgi:general stress protein 26